MNPPQPTTSQPPQPIHHPVVYLIYNDNVDDKRVNALMGIISNIINQTDTLYILFSSHGGSVDAGLVLYNFLRSLPIKIVMHNIGVIDSIANVIFVAATERYACPRSTFLFHGVNFPLPGNTYTHAQINELRDRMIKDENKIAGILCEQTKLTEAELRELFREGETKDEGFALEKNIINEVKFPQIPKNTPIVSININV